MNGQLKYLWDVGSDMIKARDNKDDRECHYQASRLFRLRIEKNMYIKKSYENDNLKMFFWETYEQNMYIKKSYENDNLKRFFWETYEELKALKEA